MNDEEFSPFFDELLDKGDYDCCQNLIDSKKFTGEREACPDFDPIENLGEPGISDGFFDKFDICIQDRADQGKLVSGTIDEIISMIDFQTMPVDKYIYILHNATARDEKYSAISSLGIMISHRNKAAFTALFEFLKKLPPPLSIEAVHLRIEILQKLKNSKRKKEITRFLFKELKRTPSNNTTRQWFTSIFKYLESLPFEDIEKPLSELLYDKRFSHRLKKRMREILYYSEVNSIRENFGIF
ncbi:MAG: hypothetical protein U9N73_01405 [Candidatus Auribacterota bacterium]|nr:hypothetical protein [Candidatus Auribacterota bacterium]